VSPEFDEILGDDDSPADVASWRVVHDLLLSASAPPALGERVARVPHVRALVPRSRAMAALSLATTVAVAVGLGVGYSIGHRGFQTDFTRPMHGIGAARAASALIRVGGPGEAGNRTLEMSVRALPALPAGGWYELYLTKKGKAVLPCGSFRTGVSGSAQVDMNVPGALGEYDGWNVTALTPGHPPRVLLTT
jgi:hypothetical protein